MEITPNTMVAELATNEPATIKVFQKNGIDFCCGGKMPLADACASKGVDVDGILAELQAVATSGDSEPVDWQRAPLSALVAHVQRQYHVPLREELPRLSAMLAKVVMRHGDRLPDTLLPLQATYERFQRELLEHMQKEDHVLFPSIVALERAGESAHGYFLSIDGPVAVMETEHEEAGAALARMREITNGYMPPADACPTFRGLYYGLSELEREMHVHVHLENNILFPRAGRLQRQLAG